MLKISRANKKMNCPCLDKIAGGTGYMQHGTNMCHELCYANQACYREVFHATADLQRNNTAILESRLTPELIRDIFLASLEPRDQYTPYFRFLSTGEIASSAEFEAYCLIAQAMPETQFLLFTKSFISYPASLFSHAPANMSVYFSLFPDSNFVMLDQVVSALTIYGIPAHVAVAGNLIHFPDWIRDNQWFVCPGECGECRYCFWGEGNVVFPIHPRSLHNKYDRLITERSIR